MDLVLAGYIVPPACGLVVVLILILRRASPRRRAHGAVLASFWVLTIFMSIQDGQFDGVLFLMFLPFITGIAVGLVEIFRWLDRRSGRGRLWE